MSNQTHSDEQDGASPEEGIPKTDSGINPSSLRLSQDFNEGLGVKRRHTLIQVRKPGKQEYIRVHPDPEFSLQTALLDFNEDGEIYLVDPSLWPQLPGELIRKVLYLTVNRQGAPRLWPIRLPDEEGKLDSWNFSALQAAEIAKERWVRVSSNRGAGMYETYEATAELPEPEWPDLPFASILDIAFRGRYIKDWDHSALAKLRGEI
jgi:hypothetical protein